MTMTDTLGTDPLAFSVDDIDPNAPIEMEPAPYGRTLDGKPKERPGRKPAVKKAAGRPSARSTRATPAAPPRKSPAKFVPAKSPKTLPPVAAGAPGAIDYHAGVATYAMIPAGALVGIGLKKRNPAFFADATAIANTVPAIAEGLEAVVTALPDSAFALWVKRAFAASPFAAFGAAIVGLGAQIMTNHGVTGVGTLGSVDPRELVDPAMLLAIATDMDVNVDS